MTQQFIPKPPNRESILFFGDGDEAVFGHIGNSIEEGYYIVHFRPTKKMRWIKQIPDSEYDPKDMWIKKIYKKDLCIPLSIDPDFPMWAILCDYRANENTPLFKFFAAHLMNCPHCDKQIFVNIGIESLLLKNRDLDRKIRNLLIERNRKMLEQKKKDMHPDEWLEEKFRFTEKAKKAIGEPIVIDRGQQENPEEES
mgnify:CR=1 FL=1